MLTQAEIEEQIGQLIDRMETQTDELAVLLVAASRSEVDYKRSYAIAFASGAGSVKDREQMATQTTVDAMSKAKYDDALAKSKAEALRTTRAGLDAMRTLAANVRAQT